MSDEYTLTKVEQLNLILDEFVVYRKDENEFTVTEYSRFIKALKGLVLNG
jgi:hypothetical protein